MNSTDNWLVHEHSLYEDLLSECMDSVEADDWAGADRTFRELITHLKRHIDIEEGVLFPAYEATTHAPQGPTTALREDHDQIVRLVQDMVRVIKTKDSDYVTECLAQLEHQMIKHHEKEEDIFLPMAGYVLSTRREELSRQLDEFTSSHAGRKWKI